MNRKVNVTRNDYIFKSALGNPLEYRWGALLGLSRGKMKKSENIFWRAEFL